MIKKNLIIIFFAFFITAAYSASTSSGSGEAEGNDGPPPAKNYKLGYKELKRAEKLDKKGKIEKAKKRFNKALEHLIKANDKNPNQPDILNYLGFAYRKTGDLMMAEVYYLQGLKIDPNHIGINEYLGELYIKTNRIDLAKQRLEILKDCTCEEYDELKELIENN